jgi:hypothetical protein
VVSRDRALPVVRQGDKPPLSPTRLQTTSRGQKENQSESRPRPLQGREGMTAFTIHPHRSRSASPQCVVRCPSDDGYKTRAARLAEALKGRWTHRAGGYIMSSRKAEQFVTLYGEGWDGCFMQNKLVAPEVRV